MCTLEIHIGSPYAAAASRTNSGVGVEVFMPGRRALAAHAALQRQQNSASAPSSSSSVPPT